MSVEPSVKSSMQVVSIGPVSVEIPEDWDLVSLDEISENSGQYGANASAEAYDTSEFRYVRITDISEEGELKHDEKKSIPIDSNEKYRLEEGDLLFARTGAVGRSYLYSPEDSDIDCAFAGYLIRYKLDENVCSEYISQFTGSQYFTKWVNSMARSTTHANINASEYSSLEIPYPPLPEQRRIADILSTVDEQIQQTDEAIDKTKELKRGLMQDLLTEGIMHNEYKKIYLGPRRLDIPRGWKKARLEEVSEIITRGKQPTYVNEGGVPVLNQSCIYWNGFHPEELKRLDSEVADGWKDKYWVKEGDVLINSTGKGTLGRALEWTKESDTHALDSHITRVHPDKSVLDPTYFRFYLESNHGQKMLYAFCVAGSTGQIELSKTDLQTMPILLPPVEEQREISEAFHRVNKKLQDEQETKEELQELKRGLMQDLLTGKVRVNTDD